MTKLTDVQESILSEALASEDRIYVAIFEEGATDEEREVEKELPLMVDHNLLQEVSPGQYRVTSDGQMMLRQHQSKRGRILAVSGAVLLPVISIIWGTIRGLAGEWASFLFGPGRDF